MWKYSFQNDLLFDSDDDVISTKTSPTNGYLLGITFRRPKVVMTVTVRYTYHQGEEEGETDVTVVVEDEEDTDMDT